MLSALFSECTQQWEEAPGVMVGCHDGGWAPNFPGILDIGGIA